VPCAPDYLPPYAVREKRRRVNLSFSPVPRGKRKGGN
jgi:hypothetical protein